MMRTSKLEIKSIYATGRMKESNERNNSEEERMKESEGMIKEALRWVFGSALHASENHTSATKLIWNFIWWVIITFQEGLIPAFEESIINKKEVSESEIELESKLQEEKEVNQHALWIE